jgi:hypothetical protein
MGGYAWERRGDVEWIVKGDRNRQYPNIRKNWHDVKGFGFGGKEDGRGIGIGREKWGGGEMESTRVKGNGEVVRGGENEDTAVREYGKEVVESGTWNGLRIDRGALGIFPGGRPDCEKVM